MNPSDITPEMIERYMSATEDACRALGGYVAMRTSENCEIVRKGLEAALCERRKGDRRNIGTAPKEAPKAAVGACDAGVERAEPSEPESDGKGWLHYRATDAYYKGKRVTMWGLNRHRRASDHPGLAMTGGASNSARQDENQNPDMGIR